MIFAKITFFLMLFFVSTSYAQNNPELRLKRVDRAQEESDAFDALAHEADELEATPTNDPVREKIRIKVQENPSADVEPKPSLISKVKKKFKKEKPRIVIKPGEDLKKVDSLSVAEKEFIKEIISEGLIENWDKLPSEEEFQLSKHLDAHKFGLEWKINQNSFIKVDTKDDKSILLGLIAESHGTKAIKKYKIKKVENRFQNPEFEINGKSVVLEAIPEAETSSYRTQGITTASKKEIQEFHLSEPLKKPNFQSDVRGCLRAAITRKLAIAALILAGPALSSVHEKVVTKLNDPTSEYQQSTDELVRLEVEKIKSIRRSKGNVSLDTTNKELVEFLKEHQKKLKAGHFAALLQAQGWLEDPLMNDQPGPALKALVENLNTDRITVEDFAWNMDQMPEKVASLLTLNQKMEILSHLKKLNQKIEPLSLTPEILKSQVKQKEVKTRYGAISTVEAARKFETVGKTMGAYLTDQELPTTNEQMIELYLLLPEHYADKYIQSYMHYRGKTFTSDQLKRLKANSSTESFNKIRDYIPLNNF